ncbi:MAG: hypothetical protein KR126chlam3_00777 [Chlamydiae bacterium]|nr:hypothetical protein [Chlamydiota bacterium]
MFNSSREPAVTRLALTNIREICKNYLGIEKSIAMINVIRRYLPSITEKAEFIGSICAEVKKDVQEKVRNEPVGAIKFIKGLLAKWPETWSHLGYGNTSYEEISIRGKCS